MCDAIGERSLAGEVEDTRCGLSTLGRVPGRNSVALPLTVDGGEGNRRRDDSSDKETEMAKLTSSFTLSASDGYTIAYRLMDG